MRRSGWGGALAFACSIICLFMPSHSNVYWLWSSDRIATQRFLCQGVGHQGCLHCASVPIIRIIDCRPLLLSYCV